MSELSLRAAAKVAARLTDVPHRLGVAIYANGPSSWAAAIVDAKNGDVLAWDGWYEDALDAARREPLEVLRWDEWDDMPSKLLVERNAPWLGGPLAHELMPSYSFARWAASIIATHADSPEYDTSRSGFQKGDLVAYFPVVDEASVVDHLEANAERARTSIVAESATAQARATLARVRGLFA